MSDASDSNKRDQELSPSGASRLHISSLSTLTTDQLARVLSGADQLAAARAATERARLASFGTTGDRLSEATNQLSLSDHGACSQEILNEDKEPRRLDFGSGDNSLGRRPTFSDTTQE